MNESTIDKELRQLRELESSLQSLAKCIDAIRNERDRLRDENTRLQSEVQRLRVANAEAVHALTRVSKLNPNVSEIGAGMLATIVTESLTALAKMESTT